MMENSPNHIPAGGNEPQGGDAVAQQAPAQAKAAQPAQAQQAAWQAAAQQAQATSAFQPSQVRQAPVQAQQSAPAYVAQPAQAQSQISQLQPAAQAQAQPAVQAQAQPAVQAQAQAQQPTQAQASQQPPRAQQQAERPQAPGGYVAPAAQIGAPAAGYTYGYAPGQAPGELPAQKKGKGWIVAIVVIVCLFAFTAFCVHTCSATVGSLYHTSGGTGIEDVSGPTIGVIDLDGTIQYDGTACSPEGLKELLDEAAENSNVKAIVLRVNSGGGTATAGEEMASYLREFEKPVVVSSASINASAAYEISAQADYIFVAKSTEIGAIGTVMEMRDLSGLFEKLGISMEVIASAESKDSSYGYRALTDEEREYYQKMVDQINDLFVDNVAQGRKMDEAAVRKLATGLVFTGADAVENGLADEVGTREDAVKKAAELAGVSDYDVRDLYLPSYDISSLASLLGESRVSADDVLDALAALKEDGHASVE